MRDTSLWHNLQFVEGGMCLVVYVEVHVISKFWKIYFSWKYFYVSKLDILSEEWYFIYSISLSSTQIIVSQILFMVRCIR